MLRWRPPSVAYEAAFDLAVMGLCLWYDRRKPFTGATFLAIAALCSAERFPLEFFRADSLRTVANLNAARVASILTVAVVAAFRWWQTRRREVHHTT